MARVISNDSKVRTADGLVATANGRRIRRAFSTREQAADLRVIVGTSPKDRNLRCGMAPNDSRGEKSSGASPWDLAEISAVLSGANPGDGSGGMEVREAKPSKVG